MKIPNQTDDLVSIGKAEKILQVHQDTIKRWVDKGFVLCYITPGGHRRFSRADLETYYEQWAEKNRQQRAANALHDYSI